MQQKRMIAQIAARRRQGAFTLIELIVVIFLILVLAAILLIAILAIFSTNKNKATATNMQSIGNGVMQVMAQSPGAYDMLAGGEGTIFADEALKRFDLPATVDESLSNDLALHTQRSALLALICFPQTPALTRGGNPISYQVPLEATEIRGFVNTEISGASSDYPVFVDAWGNPITYRRDPDKKAITGNGDRLSLQLVSAGEDGDYSTEADNIYWSTATRDIVDLAVDDE